MDLKIILISILLIALAVVGIMIKFLMRPGGSLPKGSCGYRTGSMEDGCDACEFKNSERCSEVSSTDRVLK